MCHVDVFVSGACACETKAPLVHILASTVKVLIANESVCVRTRMHMGVHNKTSTCIVRIHALAPIRPILTEQISQTTAFLRNPSVVIK